MSVEGNDHPESRSLSYRQDESGEENDPPKPRSSSPSDQKDESSVNENDHPEARSNHVRAEPTANSLCALTIVCDEIFQNQEQHNSHSICKHQTEKSKTTARRTKKVNKFVVECSCSLCGMLIYYETVDNAKVPQTDPARLKTHVHEYHGEKPDVKANYIVKFKHLNTKYGLAGNNQPKSRSLSLSSLVPKNQLEGFTIDEESKANTVWVNVPTVKQVTTPVKGRSPVLVPDDTSDEDSDATIPITGGDILSTLRNPLLVLHHVSDEDIEMMTQSLETFDNIYA